MHVFLLASVMAEESEESQLVSAPRSEMEGPPICREILARHAFSTEKTEHVCGIVAINHTAHDLDIVSKVEFRILWDADWLVNFPGRYRAATTQEREEAIEEIVRTARGRLLARQLFLE
jgi:hypothetical protein